MPVRERKEVEEVLHEPLWNQPIPTMIKNLTDAEKAQMHDQLWRTITEQAGLVAQLSDELAAMTKTLDKAGDMLELMTKTATENREAYEAETLSTLEMAKRITQLEGEVAAWSRRALNEQRMVAETSAALRGLLEAEEATIDEFNAKEIDGLESAMNEARRVFGILGQNS
jgi:uncharacterized coiled-coil protein SlyX